MVSPTALLAKCGKKLQEKKAATQRAFSSRENFIRALETDTTAHGNGEERTIWKNEDLDLSPPKAWSWGWYDYGAFCKFKCPGTSCCVTSTTSNSL